MNILIVEDDNYINKLPIVKSLMEKMNGDIDVKVKDNKIYLICSWKIVYRN